MQKSEYRPIRAPASHVRSCTSPNHTSSSSSLLRHRTNSPLLRTLNTRMHNNPPLMMPKRRLRLRTLLALLTLLRRRMSRRQHRRYRPHNRANLIVQLLLLGAEIFQGRAGRSVVDVAGLVAGRGDGRVLEEIGVVVCGSVCDGANLRVS